MLLDDLVYRCYTRDMQRDRGVRCIDCRYRDYCTGNCQDCLRDIHFRNNDFHREYDCPHMADCYYCKYAYKYASEIVYALRWFGNILNKKELDVLSIGCGPCTDLAGIDFLRNTGELQINKLNYVGVDHLDKVWGHIWNDIQNCYEGVNIFPQDIFQYLYYLVQSNWVPDLIIFQYVFSDMCKNSDKGQILEFINDMANFINSHNDKPICILCNDINLSVGRGGGRDFFEEMVNRINEPRDYWRKHFNNSNRDGHFEYGIQYDSNSLVFGEIPEVIMSKYNPYTSCASAQMLIVK